MGQWDGFEVLPVECSGELERTRCGNHWADGRPAKIYKKPERWDQPKEAYWVALRCTRGLEVWACEKCAKLLGLEEVA